VVGVARSERAGGCAVADTGWHVARVAEPDPLAIRLAGLRATSDPIEASLLAPDPFAMDSTDESAADFSLLLAERLEAAARAAVPEPSAALALGLGLLGFATLRRATGVYRSG
jgi:hypothetical protein